MTDLRHAILRRPWLTVWLVLAALTLRLLVPAGYMPSVAADGSVALQICAGAAPAPMVMTGAQHRFPSPHNGHDAPAKAEQPCAFAGLATPMLGAADPVLLAIALAFVLALAIRRTAAPPLTRVSRLRPPLRGPPLPA